MQDPSLVILASAGTGKTYQLSNRFLELLFTGISPRQILATTFTRKAAGEIGARVLQRLAASVLHEEHRKELEQSLSMSISVEMCRRTFLGLIQSIADLQIQTIDSVCLNLTRAFAFDLGVPLQLSVLERLDSREIAETALLKLLIEVDIEVITKAIALIRDQPSERTVSSRLMPALGELAYLYFDAPDSAWQPFGSDAEIKPVFPKEMLLKTLAELPLPPTKKGSANQNWLKAQSKIEESILQEDFDALVSHTLIVRSHQNAGEYYGSAIPDEWVNFREQLGEFICQFLRYQNTHALSALRQLIAPYCLFVEEEKNKQGLYQFDDLKRLLAAFRTRDYQQLLSYRLGVTFNHLLFDEFQDSSVLDYSMLSPLISEIASELGSEKSFFCVGDKKQAIYGWRGGAAEVFEKLQSDYPQLASKPQTMTKSYRSSPVILNFVNTLFSALKNSEELFPEEIDSSLMTTFEHVNEWTSTYESHQSALSELAGHVSVTIQDEWQQIFLQQLHTIVCTQQEKRCAILTRTNGELDIIEAMLRKEGLGDNVARAGKSPILDSQFGRILYAHFWLMAYPGDSEKALYLEMQSLNCPLLGEDGVVAIEKVLHERSRFYQIGSVAYVEYALRLYEGVAKSNEEYLASSQGLLDILARERNISIAKLALRLMDIDANIQSTNKTIILMTIHGSKGLEFDYVFLPNVNFELWSYGKLPTVLTDQKSGFDQITKIFRKPSKYYAPYSRDISSALVAAQRRQTHESLSLLYVALTRAKQAMFLSIPPKPKEFSVIRVSDLLRQCFFSNTKNIYEHGELDRVLNSHIKKLFHKTVIETKTQTISLGKRDIEHKETATKRAVIDSPHVQTSLDRGRNFHSLLEKIEWFSKTALELQIDKKAFSDVDRMQVEKFFQSTKVQTIFSNTEKRWTRLRKEQGVMANINGVVRKGIIDRLHLGNNEAEIIDFKWSLQDPQLFSHYEDQLRTYRTLVEKVYSIPIERISCFLVCVVPEAEVTKIY